MDFFINWIMASGVGPYVVVVVTCANAITTLLPSSIKGSAGYNVAMKVLNFLSMNVGANANKDDQTLAQSLK